MEKSRFSLYEFLCYKGNASPGACPPASTQISIQVNGLCIVKPLAYQKTARLFLGFLNFLIS
jgi:hypothetical protein